MSDVFAHVVRSAKAYAAAAASVVAVLSGLFAADTEVGKVLLVVSPILAWVATWKVPNTDMVEDYGDPNYVPDHDPRDSDISH